jgi:hypothetical protein
MLPDGSGFVMERVRPGTPAVLTQAWRLHFANLLGYLRESLETSVRVRVPTEKYATKLGMLKSVLGEDPVFRQAAERLLVRFRAGGWYREGRMHGDLTLCNVLQGQRRSTVLVDFLDGVSSTPIADVAKLRQDTRHRWIARFTRVPWQRLAVLDRMLRKEVRAWPEVADWAPAFTLLALLRIVPYARDDATREYLRREVRRADVDLGVRWA